MIDAPPNRDSPTFATDLSFCLRAVAENPNNAELRVAMGHQLFEKGQFAAAAANFRKAIALHPNHTVAHISLDWAMKGMRGESQEGVADYQRNLQLHRSLQRDLARVLGRMGWADESFRLWQEVVVEDPGSLAFIGELATNAIHDGDLRLAAEYAAMDAGLRLGSQWYPNRRNRDLAAIQLRSSALTLTIPKLMHDIDQFLYLQNRSVLSDEFTQIVIDYRRTLDRLVQIGPDARETLNDEEQRTIGHVYNRIVHVRDTPRLERALSGTWDSAALEKQYFDNPPGIVVVDDFLSSEALENLRLFCLESTIWSNNQYAHGRLGSFFRDGFNCPLLIQIAEELRRTFPRLIGDRYPLRQMWGFKYRSTSPDESIHADFAAVNVNFWITPDSANLDPTAGGLIVYDCEAPLDWNFDTYNRRSDVIQEFLQSQHARGINIPYRQNRAVIFNSDLFHRTAPLRFQTDYEFRRVNITMLYGDREKAIHRP
jgi:tetratricopeptide (TPR) repeat protein